MNLPFRGIEDQIAHGETLWNYFPNRPDWKGKSGKISTPLDINSRTREEKQNEKGVTYSRIVRDFINPWS